MITQKKKTKRTLQAEATKEKIIDATMELMEKKGLSEMTIQDIHRKAGISVGTFYHYYSTKEDVFFELYRKADEYFETEVVPFLEKDPLTTVEKVVLFFRYYALFNEAHDVEFSKQLYSTKNKMFISEKRFMISLLQSIIADGQESGEIDDSWTSDVITNYLFIFSRGLIFDWCLHDGDYQLSDTIVTDITLLMGIFTK
ncbi:MAG: TetR/AcrR family transcriptional regulator [Spirochaetales bacterium]|nr:TetR/AcrR family transcriptional regulator [Spirochaetales bacterium]